MERGSGIYNSGIRGGARYTASTIGLAHRFSEYPVSELPTA